MKILLAYPEMPDTFWSMQHALKVFGKSAFYPPLGLLTVAALLPGEWEKRLVDVNVRPLTDDDLQWADYVFVSAMNVQEQSARAIISQARAEGVPVVAGGPLFTHEWELFPEVDHFVLNEAELTLPPFLADLERGAAQRLYAAPHEFSDMHATPVPMWELAPVDRYQNGIVQYSRGCPYECDFCDVTALFGRRPRVKTAEQIITEIDQILASCDFDLILFADDNLIGNKKHLKNEMLPALIEWRRKKRPSVYFSTQVTVNLADDDELMELMLEAGFRYIFVGIETPEEETLKSCKKRQNTKRDLLQNVTRLQEAGFIVVAGFIVGFDTDTEDIFERQADFIQESGIALATMNLLKAPPGTELFERMKAEGRLLGRFSFDETRTNFIPAMDPDMLYEGFDRLIAEVYSPDRVYDRTVTFLRHYRPPRVRTSIPDPSPLKYLGAAIRGIRHVGLSRHEGRYFWRLLWWAIRNDPRLLDQAFVGAVMIYQLRMLHEGYLKARTAGTPIAAATHPMALTSTIQ